MMGTVAPRWYGQRWSAYVMWLRREESIGSMTIVLIALLATTPTKFYWLRNSRTKGSKSSSSIGHLGILRRISSCYKSKESMRNTNGRNFCNVAVERNDMLPKRDTYA